MTYKDKIKDSHEGNYHDTSEIWNDCLAIEAECVATFCTWIESNEGIIMHETQGYNADYDVEAFYRPDVVVCTFELKAEPEAQDYGTCFVEYLQKGRPSGLALTKSDYYYFLTGSKGELTTAYLIPTQTVKDIGRSLPPEYHVQGGLNKTATGFKMDLYDIDKYRILK